MELSVLQDVRSLRGYYNSEVFVKEVMVDVFSHPKLKPLHGVYIRVKELPHGHFLLGGVDLSVFRKLYTFDSKSFGYFFPDIEVSDLNILRVLHGLRAISFTDKFYQFFKSYIPIWGAMESLVIPEVLWVEFFDYFFSLLWFDFEYRCPLYEVDSVKVFRDIERVGIGVSNFSLDRLKSPEKSIRGSILYSSYSLDNLVARPSNSFNGLNFMALGKTREARESFVPKNDFIIEFDYDAYHLRLIAEQCGVVIRGARVHEYFAKIYFDKKEVSREDYDRSKKLSFKLLYSGIDKSYLGFEFFSKADELIRGLWDRYREVGYVECPISKRRVSNVVKPTANKVFAYWMQCLETSTNIGVLRDILELLKGKKSHLVFYQFDSILLDLHRDEEDMVDKVELCMRYPVKVGRYLSFPY